MDGKVRGDVCGLIGALLLSASTWCATAGPVPHLRIIIDTDRATGSIVPSEAFGLAFDGGDREESAPLFHPATRSAITAAGAIQGSYRLRTELGIEAWHWSAYGRWSDPEHHSGYWTGDPDRDDPAEVSYGYRLPRRGDTADEADNSGYSRIDDGDPASFWKSNPYLALDEAGQAVERKEWVKLDLGAATPVDTLEVDWAQPYATEYSVQYWGGDNPFNGAWRTFPKGEVTQGAGGVERIRLATAPMSVRYVRLVLTRSSRTAPAGAADPRDAAGFAIGELKLGRTMPDGDLQDAIRHGADAHRQTLVYVSSTDPWHRAEDLDPSTEQPSPLALIKAGLIDRRSLMLPVGVLYDTPDNAAAALKYFGRRGVRLRRVELGEEPDGQRVDPEDYAALYTTFVQRLRPLQSGLVFGGPSQLNGVSAVWLDENPDQSWTVRFLRSLQARGASDELGFFSFEFYPFDDLCGPISDKIARQPTVMARTLARLAKDGLPAATPKYITELGLSAFMGRAEVESPSAVFTADAVAGFLSRGGKTAFLYGSTPNLPGEGKTACAGKGNLMLWEVRRGRARWPMPSFYAVRMLARSWVQPGDAPNTILAVDGLPAGVVGQGVGAYPLRLPDGRLSILLINRGKTPVDVQLALAKTGAAPRSGAEILRYGARQYTWSVRRNHPVVDRPPGRSVSTAWPKTLRLSPLSILLVRTDRPAG